MATPHSGVEHENKRCKGENLILNNGKIYFSSKKVEKWWLISEGNVQYAGVNCQLYPITWRWYWWCWRRRKAYRFSCSLSPVTFSGRLPCPSPLDQRRCAYCPTTAWERRWWRTDSRSFPGLIERGMEWVGSWNELFLKPCKRSFWCNIAEFVLTYRRSP